MFLLFMVSLAEPHDDKETRYHGREDVRLIWYVIINIVYSTVFFLEGAPKGWV